MSVTEYEIKFVELARFAPKLVNDERERVHKFKMGLKTKIWKQRISYELTTYMDVVNKALIIEGEINKECAKREKN